MDVTRELASFVESGVDSPMTQRATGLVSRSIIDWVGCALSGSASEAADLAGRYARTALSGGSHRVVGSSLRLDAAGAAWMNGVQGHVDDFDDSGSHPASYLTPTVLALGEEVQATGAQVIAAWAIGYQVATALGHGIHPDRGWHTTSLYGTLGAAAAASAMLALSRDQVEVALGIAGSQTAGLMGNFGRMAKSLHPANAARSGIEAARLALVGFEAAPGIVERRYGLADCFGGTKTHLPSIIRGVRSGMLIDLEPPVIKAWPSCTGTHRSLTAVLAFVESEAPRPDDIVRVDHWSPLTPGEGPLQFSSSVSTPLQGKFSLEYCIAAALIDGQVDHGTFTPERFARGDIQQLMERIHRHRSPEAALHSPRTADGIDVDALAIEVRGRPVRHIKLGARTVLDGADVESKFLANARRGNPAVPPEELLEAFRDLSAAPSIAHLMTMTASPDAD